MFKLKDIIKNKKDQEGISIKITEWVDLFNVDINQLKLDVVGTAYNRFNDKTIIVKYNKNTFLVFNLDNITEILIKFEGD